MFLASLSWLLGIVGVGAASVIQVDNSHTNEGSLPVLNSFVSYSIEFSSFPDFAGNISQPNTFSDTLLNNIGNILGSRPIVRVGGNTQDYALFDPDLGVAINGTFTDAAEDYPTIISIGESYFQSYQTWSNTKFIHGFNLGKNSSAAYDTLAATVPLACQSLKGKLEHWELGNEPDLFKTSAQGIVRPSSWTEQDYVDEWLNKTRLVGSLVSEHCPDDEPYSYIAPSFAGTRNSLDPVRPWRLGLNNDKNIAQISTHNYMGGAEEPGVTLQNRLMNHTAVVNAIYPQVNVSNLLSNFSLPFIMGETNSLYNQGRPGLSNTFGAGLWGVDFNLWCASQGIQRVHMHMGTNYRYASWQPIQTEKATLGTKAPYYGNIAVASMLGQTTKHKTVVQNIPLSDELEAAYAAYEDTQLARIAIINLNQYNFTNEGEPFPRPEVEYSFCIPGMDVSRVGVRRLMANGSDSITGITFDGYSYNYELDQGRPVRLDNVTVGEFVDVDSDGGFTVVVPWSSAAILDISKATSSDI